MKRFLAAIVGASLIAAPATAAPKSVTVGLGSIYSAPTNTETMVQSGKNLIFISNTNLTTSDISITAQDLTRNQAWQLTIDSGSDEAFTAATIDLQGNIWLAGSAALPAVVETATPIIGIDNPDNVQIESSTAMREDMDQLSLWKVSPAGELLATYLNPVKVIPVVSAISVANSGISIVGSLNAKPFFITATLTGEFGKLVSIGSEKSEINAVVRHSDGTSSLFGSSAETLAGKPVAGIRDGFLARVSKTGAITKVVRSSAQKAARSWLTGDSNFLLTGPVITGKVRESAITKFNSSFAPVWTTRIASTGVSRSLSANGNSYLAISSRGPITGISGWRPTSPSLLVITFDGKGVIKGATALPGLVTPLTLTYSKERGVTGLASSSDGTVSIFTLVSR